MFWGNSSSSASRRRLNPDEGNDQDGLAMTDLTAREILDAIRRGLEETARKLAGNAPGQAHSRPDQPSDDGVEKNKQAEQQKAP